MAVVIESENISKSYDKKEVLHQVNLKIEEGEVFGLLGPSGAGKTTFIRIAAGVERATSGRVSVLGQYQPNMHSIAGLGLMPQSDALYPDLTGLDNLEFFGALTGMKGKALHQACDRAAALVGLSNDMKKKVWAYSGGMKKRLSLATALLHSPRLLILDEPTVGIDPAMRRDIWQEFHRLSRDEGVTLLITTHVMDEAEKCDRLGVIREGKLIATGSVEEIKSKNPDGTLEGIFFVGGGESA